MTKRQAGAIGGRLSASRMSPEQRMERAKLAGQATLLRYGVGYYTALVSLSSKRKKK